MSLDESFQKTCEYVGKNTLKINQSTLLKLYSYYKQATKGDVVGERPGKMDFMGRAKIDCWSSLAGMSVEEAKENYVRIGRNSISSIRRNPASRKGMGPPKRC